MSFMTLSASLLLAQQVVVGAGVSEESMHENGWEQVWEADAEEGERQARAFIHPLSIRLATGEPSVYSVAVALEWWYPEGVSDERGVRSSGYLIDCSAGTVRVEWFQDFYRGSPVPRYVLEPIAREPRGMQVPIVNRVCEDL